MKQALHLLKEFYAAKGLKNVQEHCYDKDKLNSTLKLFYENVRKKDGSLHSKNSLTSLPYGLARYFFISKKVDIVSDTEFRSPKETFLTVTTVLKTLEKAKVNHHPEITQQV